MWIVLVYLALFGLIALAVRFRSSWWAGELFKSYGIQPSGPFQSFTRRDFARGSLIAGIAAIVCFLMMLAGFWFGDRQPLNSKLQQFGMVYFFVFFLLFVLAAVSASILLGKAVFARPWPDLPFCIIAYGTPIGFTAIENTDPETSRRYGRLYPHATRSARRILRALSQDVNAAGSNDLFIVSSSLEVVPTTSVLIRSHADAHGDFEVSCQLPGSGES